MTFSFDATHRVPTMMVIAETRSILRRVAGDLVATSAIRMTPFSCTTFSPANKEEQKIALPNIDRFTRSNRKGNQKESMDGSRIKVFTYINCWQWI